jgi:Transposase and inactivated derivatives
VALVHRIRVRSGDSPSLDVLKNRHGRFQESNLFQELFERIVEQCIAAGLVEGEQMSVDGSFIMANRAITAVFPANSSRRQRR